MKTLEGKARDVAMQQTQTAPRVSPVERDIQAAQRAARATAELVVRKVKHGRFSRRDVRYDIRRGELIIGIWLVDRDTGEFAHGRWPIHRATFHWRLHELVISNALNFELQIDEDVPFAQLSRASFHEEHFAFFYFEKAMRITVGIAGLSVAHRRADAIRKDWGVPGWTLALASNRSIPMI